MIRDEYKEQLKQTRRREEKWGSTGGKNGAPEIIRCLSRSQHKLGCVSVLDFGAGLGTLGEAVRRSDLKGLEWHEYDPSVEGIDTIPNRSFDVIVSTDVMEHVEPDSLHETLRWQFEHADKAMFHMIACGPTNKKLPDGRDVHLIQQQMPWWRSKYAHPEWLLMEYAEVQQYRRGAMRERGWLYMEKL